MSPYLLVTCQFAGQGESRDNATSSVPVQLLCAAQSTLAAEADCVATHQLGAVDIHSGGDASQLQSPLSTLHGVTAGVFLQDGMAQAFAESLPKPPAWTAAAGHSLGSLNAVALATARSLPDSADLFSRYASQTEAACCLTRLQALVAVRLLVCFVCCISARELERAPHKHGRSSVI